MAGRCSVVEVGVVVDVLVTAVELDVVDDVCVDVEVVDVLVVVAVVVGGQAVGWQLACWCGRASTSHELSSTRTPDDSRQLTARCWTPAPHVVEHCRTPTTAQLSLLTAAGSRVAWQKCAHSPYMITL